MHASLLLARVRTMCAYGALNSGGHDDVVARLLDAGAVPSIKDKKGRTALAYATRLGREAVRRRLLVAGRDGAPDRPQSSGQSEDTVAVQLDLDA